MNWFLKASSKCIALNLLVKDEKMKITIDAMGGDNAPKAQVLGAMKAVEAFSDVEITLIGNESEINQYLAKHGRIRVIHTDEKY